ncbi:polysaccharide lyase 8 family protein [Kribbella antibiotica]|nr:polysaccharide lyase 8 family protein [Kribbella antibiotica]
MGAEHIALRARWADILIGREIDPGDPIFCGALRRMSDEAVALTEVLRAGLEHHNSMLMRQSFQLLRTLAVACRTPGAAQYGDAGLATEIVAGLDLLCERAYRPGVEPAGNWWDWEIGTPHALTDTCVLLYDILIPDQLAGYLAAVEHFVPDPRWQQAGVNPSTGANRSDLCRAQILCGLLAGDDQKISEGVAALPPSYAWSDSGDGLHKDGSFIQHYNIPYTGLYGVILLDGLANLFALLAGSRWEISDRSILHEAALEVFAPVVWNGLVFDAVRGRGVVRSYRSDHKDGRLVIAALLRLAEDVQPEVASRYRSLAKGWIERSGHEPFIDHAFVPQLALAKAVLSDRTVLPAPEPVEHRQFPDMDRVVHRRPGWAFVISMASSRVGRYEGGPIENENLRGWHTAAGMTYLYVDGDRGQFSDGFWPTVDPYRLPGTTVDTLRLAAGDGYRETTSANWVGGTTLGQFGAVGMQLEGLGSGEVASSLRATKSWFCLDDVVVALGAGIAATDGRTIETTVENRHLKDVELVIDGRDYPIAGAPAVVDGTRWAHLGGVGGYRFLVPADLQIVVEDRTGSHRDIGPTDPLGTSLTRRYCTLWLDHGLNPTAGAYAYMVLPGAGQDETVARPAPQVLANTPAVQAIRDGQTGVTAANFFEAGSAGGITVSGPASVVVREQDGHLEVSVTDPTRGAGPVTAVLTWPSSAPRAG